MSQGLATHQESVTIMVSSVEYPEPAYRLPNCPQRDRFFTGGMEVYNGSVKAAYKHSPHETAHALSHNCVPGSGSVKCQAFVRYFVTMMTSCSKSSQSVTSC